jgi:hypothetical protein
VILRAGGADSTFVAAGAFSAAEAPLDDFAASVVAVFFAVRVVFPKNRTIV